MCMETAGTNRGKERERRVEWAMSKQAKDVLSKLNITDIMRQYIPDLPR